MSRRRSFILLNILAASFVVVAISVNALIFHGGAAKIAGPLGALAAAVIALATAAWYRPNESEVSLAADRAALLRLQTAIRLELGKVAPEDSRLDLCVLVGKSEQDASTEGDRPVIGEDRFLSEYVNNPTNLIVMGGPGSGKTTLLLELSQTLLTAALREEPTGFSTGRIPVMLPLRLWTSSSSSFSSWLADHGCEQFGISYSQFEKWSKDGRLLPVLDGLDELAAPVAREFVGKFHDWLKQDVGRAGVISSRGDTITNPFGKSATYITIEPLTDEQISEYLHRFALTHHEGDERQRAFIQFVIDNDRLKLLATSPASLKALARITLNDQFHIQYNNQFQLWSAEPDRSSEILKASTPRELFESLSTDEGNVLSVMEEGVSYSATQISSLALLPPSQSRAVLDKLKSKGFIESHSSSGAPMRYTRAVQSAPRQMQ